ncbi:ABC transporter substrate-binding protein [Rhodovulum sulfidophilum]|uniref:ABC transporter substrate-binding protein n=1 Tax=Rhodovulum visakhapatnamense TaxID=364297 RepID=A0ABS1RIY6_9RHOB|nr:ABC transporter substrate-binding protein [Rhodovulum visakhapatnamense]MBL3569795.1 ABC transporter substrate-binding protein [Rhodovulum visakhapatnamense]MBL3579119.1 ABC transporter substrate-binding protein [Rhodovulum visakhapatnamense]OLS45218.1 ABC transporter substrate-binding protein [Rhodovulum sulfidophilum]
MTDPFRALGRRDLLLLAGAGVAGAALPGRLHAQTPRVLVIASGQDFPNLDPHTATGYAPAFFMRNVYDPLLRISGNPPRPVPGLARSWDGSADGMTHEFHLDPAARFHSGAPVTAEDVVYSFARALRLAKGNSWMLRGILTPGGLDAVDPATVRITLAAPFAAFLQVLPWFPVVEKAAVEAHLGEDDGQSWLMTQTAGSGPFALQQARPGALYRFVRAPTAWQGGGGNLDGVIWRIAREGATERLLLQRGEIHVALDLTSEDMDALEGAPGVVRVIEPEYRTFTIKMNTRRGPLADINMRRAISHALDYDALRDTAGYADLMVGPLPLGILGHDPDLAVPRHDPDAARAHLARTATPEGGISLKIVYSANLEQQRRYALVLLDSLRALNITLEIQPMRWPEMVAACASPDTLPDFFPVYQTANYGDPDNFAYAAYHSASNGNWQNPVFADPEVDRLIEAGGTETDIDTRKAIYGDFQRKVVADAPDLFGVQERRKLGLRDAVRGHVFTPVAANAIECWPLSLV